MKIEARAFRLFFVLAVLAMFVAGCSDSSVGVPGSKDLNTPEEQKKVEEHYKQMAESGRGPGGGETGPAGSAPGGPL